ncbi:ATPase [Enterovibrio sp. ZSDZ42]|uniref:ATPase n=1 Tax=Enterovibrio gelatinilyticus TaxID=2899819 RepID=A0ABT5R801_9GAMM|nr:ATPase [Enterovibrio sp. ZSDZ42]MDD1796399.1 ATPase [Enterovibrio sp. ZSDZ42]
MKKRVIVSWSSGKDSTLTLCRLQQNPDYEVVGLYTSYVNGEVPFQATPIDIVKAQAKSIGLPLVLIELEQVFPPNHVYQQAIIEGIKDSGLEIDAVAFGDMFCNGIEAYRRSYIEPQGWECVFPLLGQSSVRLANEIIEEGIVTHLTTIDTSQLNSVFLGRLYEHQLLGELPQSCDPCGEDGEFHTLVTDAPCFSWPLAVEVDKWVLEGRFHHQIYRLSEPEI